MYHLDSFSFFAGVKDCKMFKGVFSLIISAMMAKPSVNLTRWAHLHNMLVAETLKSHQLNSRIYANKHFQDIFAYVKEAYPIVSEVAHHTPLHRSNTFSHMTGGEVYLKLAR